MVSPSSIATALPFLVRARSEVVARYVPKRPTPSAPQCATGLGLRRHLDDQHQAATALDFDIVVRGVVGDVAVQKPLARFSCLPEHVVALTGTDGDGVLHPLAFRGNRITVSLHDAKRPAMNV